MLFELTILWYKQFCLGTSLRECLTCNFKIFVESNIMQKIVAFFTFVFSFFLLQAQTDDMPHYYEIPEAPNAYSAEAVTARMMDGLGYRYYWATKDLREEDLSYKPSEDSRTSGETIQHILGLSEMILNAVQNQPNIRPREWAEMTFAEKRKQTLSNIKAASDNLRKAQTGTIDKSKIIFQRGDHTTEFPLWNLYNGPLADAIYHTGQIVAYRRASGNPIDAGVNVFLGKTRE